MAEGTSPSRTSTSQPSAQELAATCCCGICADGKRETSKPTVTPDTIATTGRTTANTGPIIASVAKIESSPEVGVDTKNDMVAPLDAPSLLNQLEIGITPQEQKGSGIPARAALNTLPAPSCAKCLRIQLVGKKACKSPDNAKPNNSHGAIASFIFQVSKSQLPNACIYPSI